MDIPSQNARYVPVFNEHDPASTPGRYESLSVRSFQRVNPGFRATFVQIKAREGDVGFSP